LGEVQSSLEFVNAGSQFGCFSAHAGILQFVQVSAQFRGTSISTFLGVAMRSAFWRFNLLRVGCVVLFADVVFV
jgi:hypothetical protein